MFGFVTSDEFPFFFPFLFRLLLLLLYFSLESAPTFGACEKHKAYHMGHVSLDARCLLAWIVSTLIYLAPMRWFILVSFPTAIECGKEVFIVAILLCRIPWEAWSLLELWDIATFFFLQWFTSATVGGYCLVFLMNWNALIDISRVSWQPNHMENIRSTFTFLPQSKRQSLLLITQLTLWRCLSTGIEKLLMFKLGSFGYRFWADQSPYRDACGFRKAQLILPN